MGENIRTLFFGSKKTGHQDCFIEVFVNSNNEITVFIGSNIERKEIISLDKDTAIKLSRGLKKNISILKTDENL